MGDDVIAVAVETMLGGQMTPVESMRQRLAEELAVPDRYRPGRAEWYAVQWSLVVTQLAAAASVLARSMSAFATAMRSLVEKVAEARERHGIA